MSQYGDPGDFGLRNKTGGMDRADRHGIQPGDMVGNDQAGASGGIGKTPVMADPDVQMAEKVETPVLNIPGDRMVGTGSGQCPEDVDSQSQDLHDPVRPSFRQGFRSQRIWRYTP